MAGVVGWVVSKLVDTVADKFLGTTIDKLTKREDGSASSSTAKDVVRGVEGLKRRLLRIQAVLDDAEERETQEKSVKLWLKEIKEVAYDAEDVLEEYQYEVLRSQIEGGAAPESEASSSSSSSSSSSCKRKREDTEVSLNVAKVLVDRVNEINDILDGINKDSGTLQLKEKDRPKHYDDSVSQQSTSSHIDESGIFGRKVDKAKIVDLLLSSHERFSVLPIIGMGGLGKTTLAQLVYNDQRIKQFFNLRGWVCVSDDFDVVRLSKAIIQCFTKESCHLTELSAIQDIIKEKLEGERVLLVLDDIWNEKQSPWDLLKTPLLQAKTIKIIITTRNYSVAEIMRTMPFYPIGMLNEEQSWLLFLRHAFASQDIDEHPILKKIGAKIVKKCGGLPLAVKVIGGLLRHKASEESWEDILQSNLWELNAIQDEILPALRLSYRYMPAYLKPCFLYCSLFPNNYFLDKGQLIRLWAAQGYIIQSKGRRSVEDIGNEYVEELQRRSLLQSVVSGRHLFFEMHDLVHDLASSIFGKECYQLTLESKKKTYDIPSEVRHLYIENKLKTVPRQLFSHPPKALHTVVFHGLELDKQFPLENLGCLRALEFTGVNEVKGLPDSIGDLKLLRSLGLNMDFFVAKTIELPESMGRLYNLQVLHVGRECEHAVLPSGIGNLVNLRSLSEVGWETHIPRGIGRLVNLERLRINVGRGDLDVGIGELKGLVRLRDLAIGGLRHVGRVEDVREADLQSKQLIQKLYLTWKTLDWYNCPVILKAVNYIDKVVDYRDEEVEADVLDGLRPCTNIRELVIRHYHGARFPSWLEEPAFPRLARVELHGIKKSERLPALGQLPSLKTLVISDMKGLKYVGREFCHARALPTKNASFPSLEVLKIHSMPEWEEWCGVVDGDFPRLSKLKILECPNLRSLPLLQNPPAMLRQLEIQFCLRLSSPVVGLHRLASLKKLSLRYCYVLRIPPYERLPSIPSYVTIKECPGLIEWCQAHGFTHQQWSNSDLNPEPVPDLDN